MRVTTIVITLAVAARLASHLVFAQDPSEELRATERQRLRSLVDADVTQAVEVMWDESV